MTGIVARCYADKFIVAITGASYSADGTVVDVRRNIQGHDGFPMVVFGRGDSKNQRAIQSEIMAVARRCNDLDEGLSWLSENLRALSEKMAGTRYHVETIVAGLSPSQGWGAWAFWSFDKCPTGRPFELERISRPGPNAMVGGPVLDLAEWQSLGAAPYDYFNEGLPWWGRHALDVFDAMRRKPGKLMDAEPDQEPGCYIGGRLDMAVVDSAGVTIRRLDSWPDRIGEKINPLLEVA